MPPLSKRNHQRTSENKPYINHLDVRGRGQARPGRPSILLMKMFVITSIVVMVQCKRPKSLWVLIAYKTCDRKPNLNSTKTHE